MEDMGNYGYTLFRTIPNHRDCNVTKTCLHTRAMMPLLQRYKITNEVALSHYCIKR